VLAIEATSKEDQLNRKLNEAASRVEGRAERESLGEKLAATDARKSYFRLESKASSAAETPPPVVAAGQPVATPFALSVVPTQPSSSMAGPSGGGGFGGGGGGAFSFVQPQVISTRMHTAAALADHKLFLMFLPLFMVPSQILVF